MHCGLSEIPKLKLSGEPTLAPWQSMHYCYRNTTLPGYSLAWLKLGVIATDSSRNIPYIGTLCMPQVGVMCIAAIVTEITLCII